jgi:hypothetical protein
MPSDVSFLDSQPEVELSRTEPVRTFIDRMNKTFEDATKALNDNREDMKQQADANRSDNSFAVGEKVLLDCSHLPSHSSHSSPLFQGPFDILEKLQNNTYRIKLPSESRLHDVFHADRIRRYFPPTHPEVNIEIPEVPNLLEEDFEIDYTENEEVKLDPKIFKFICEQLDFYPTVDLFASSKHHQIPRYYTPEKYANDRNAIGINAFKIDWKAESKPYINPPWSLIESCLKKIRKDKIRCLMIVPNWTRSPWFPVFSRMIKDSIKIIAPLYLDDHGNLRPKPRWDTIAAILDSTEQASSSSSSFVRSPAVLQL